MEATLRRALYSSVSAHAQRKFPARVSVSDHRVAWIEAEVRQWIDRKVRVRQ
ncbi:AlpA family phage regulatory protein [Bradyrhizobium sp. GCM10023182]|uniref:AlpA family phage regulatory protein n=1 Tax=Bradyrhizobium TaxID=374 RepID=UPI00362071E4